MSFFDSLGGVAGNVLDPFGFRNSSNPFISFLGNPLGILPTDGDDDDDGGDKFDPDDNWQATQNDRLMSGPKMTTGSQGQHQAFPKNEQIAAANALRGYG